MWRVRLGFRWRRCAAVEGGGTHARRDGPLDIATGVAAAVQWSWSSTQRAASGPTERALSRCSNAFTMRSTESMLFRRPSLFPRVEPRYRPLDERFRVRGPARSVCPPSREAVDTPWSRSLLEQQAPRPQSVVASSDHRVSRAASVGEPPRRPTFRHPSPPWGEKQLLAHGMVPPCRCSKRFRCPPPSLSLPMLFRCQGSADSGSGC